MNIAIIRGGHPSEHEVSLSSGQTCIDALQATHDVCDVIIQKDMSHWQIDGNNLTAAEALCHLYERVDVALLMLHGPFGEDGVIQGALQTAGIPYTGSGVHASAVANDKLVTNHLLSELKDFHIPPGVSLPQDNPVAVKAELDDLGYPLVMKPVDGGSSVETFFVDSYDKLISKLQSATHDQFMAQRCVSGTELTCGVIDVDGPATALEVIEIVPPEGSFFDYEAKYTAGASQEILPARVDKNVAQQVQTMSVQAHQKLGCNGLTRSDFILDTNGLVWFLEINTAPGMTATSLVPQELRAAGLDMSETLIQLCKQGMNR